MVDAPAFRESHIENDIGIEARVVVLGHLQRGGSPTLQDRFWATRLGREAADLVDQGRSGILPIARAGKVEVATMADAVATTRGLSQRPPRDHPPFRRRRSIVRRPADARPRYHAEVVTVPRLATPRPERRSFTAYGTGLTARFEPCEPATVVR